MNLEEKQLQEKSLEYKKYQKMHWTKATYEELVADLLLHAQEEYRKFSSKLLPGTVNMIGIRLPMLRKIAIQIAKGNYHEYFQYVTTNHFEEVMLEGFVIGYLKEEISYIGARIQMFVPKIQNWSVCDSFCSSLKITKSNKEWMYSLIRNYSYSKKEFELRFFIVMLLNYYIEEERILEILQLCERIPCTDYYVSMAVAWNISICYVKFEKITLNFLMNCKLDAVTYARTLQKICESRQVSQEKKLIIHSMRTVEQIIEEKNKDELLQRKKC